MTDTELTELSHHPNTTSGDEWKGSMKVARVYTEALIRTAEKKGLVNAIGEELDSLIDDVFAANSLLELFFETPTIKKSEKEPVLQKIFSGKASELFMDFLLLLNRHDRLDLIYFIRQVYHDIEDDRERRVRLIIKSASPLSENQLQEIKLQVANSTMLQPIVHLKIEPELIGGLVIQIGDHVYDSSVKNRIEQLSNQLLAKGSYEIQTGRNRFRDPS